MISWESKVNWQRNARLIIRKVCGGRWASVGGGGGGSGGWGWGGGGGLGGVGWGGGGGGGGSVS